MPAGKSISNVNITVTWTVRLVRRGYDDNAFNVEVVSYSAVCTLDRHGGWMGAHLWSGLYRGGG